MTQTTLSDTFQDQSNIGKTTASVLKELEAAPPAILASKLTAALGKADGGIHGDFKDAVLNSLRSLAVGDQVPTKQVIECLAHTGSGNHTVSVTAEDASLAASVLARNNIADPDGTLALGLARTSTMLANGLNNLNAASDPIPARDPPPRVAPAVVSN